MNVTSQTRETRSGRRRIPSSAYVGAQLGRVCRPERSRQDAVMGSGGAVPARQQRGLVRGLEAHEAARLEVGRDITQSQAGIARVRPDCGNSQGRTTQQSQPLRVDLVCSGSLRRKARHQATRVPAWRVQGERTAANNQAVKRIACYAYRSSRLSIATPTVVGGVSTTTPTVAMRSLFPFLSTTPTVVLLRFTICSTDFMEATQ